MFYFDDYLNKKILKSDKLTQINAFFTTRDEFDFSKIKNKQVFTPNQTHSDNVEFIELSKTEYPNTDGLIFNQKDIVVYLKFADCTPLIFYDTKNKISAISHAGWRGTAEKIAVKTVQKMQTKYNSNPQDIIVLIGPAISQCCYEVGNDVKEKLLSTVDDKEGLYSNNFVDLKQINARQLQEIGVKEIDIVSYCTSCNNDLFFSYRKENATIKRHYAVVEL